MSRQKPNMPKFLEYRALAKRFQHDKILDHDVENSDTLAGVRIVNICFKDSEQFSAQIERFAKDLGISKREFMKRSIVHCMEMADQALEHALEDFE